MYAPASRFLYTAEAYAEVLVIQGKSVPRLAPPEQRRGAATRPVAGLRVVALWTVGALLLGALVLESRDA
jgi:hypothetical protein